MQKGEAQDTKVKRGRFIVFEGIDGSGKTSQMKLFGKYLKSKKVRFIETYEPTEGPIGKLIRKALKYQLKFSWDTLQLMYSADRADHLEKLILPSLKKGITVLADRYFFSTYAYGELNLDPKWLRQLSAKFCFPDLILLIDMPAKIAVGRIDSSRIAKELYEKEIMLAKVRNNYLKMAKGFGMIVLNGTKAKDEIHQEVLEILKKKKYINE